MEPLIALLVHILVACLIFGLSYWLVNIVVAMLPPPIVPARTVLLVLLILIFILFLLGEFGVWGTWGHVYHR